MATQPIWSGVFPAVTTQFHPDLSLDLSGTCRHIEELLSHDVQGIVMLGSLGENTSLSGSEKMEVVRAAKDVVAGRVPVLSGVAEPSGHAAAAYVKSLEGVADGFMVMPAMSFRPDREETLAHYRTVAAATSLPIMVYNNPISYHADVTPSMFQELASIENLVAIKESAGDTRRVTDLVNAVGDRYALFAGVDDLALECAMLGCTGWVTGIGLAFPGENRRLWELAMSGRFEEARDLYRWYTPLMHLDVGPKFVQCLKLAIQEVGLGKEHVRLPRLRLEGEHRERTLETIREGIRTRPKL